MRYRRLSSRTTFYSCRRSDRSGRCWPHSPSTFGSENSQRKMSASTIHRAQGSEAKAVVVDLTTHSPQRLAAFFQDKHCENLFNVAISRAKDRLFVLGSRTMLRELSKTMPFWGRVVNELAQGMECLSCDEVIGPSEKTEPVVSV